MSGPYQAGSGLSQGAQPHRPMPGRSASLATYSAYTKTRATSQPAGERIPVPSSSQPGSGRGTPGGTNGEGRLGSIGSGLPEAVGGSVSGASAAGGTYGVIGGSRGSFGAGTIPGRFSGGFGGGTATRANSFSVAELRERHTGLGRTLSSHAEEHPSRSNSISPYPTFSPSSSPEGSPRMSGGNFPNRAQVPHSPPRAEANVSRSRSQSLAAGARPDMRPFGGGAGMGMSTLDSAGTAGSGGLRTFDRGWDMSPEGGNMSPFTRHAPMFGGGGDSPGWSNPYGAGTGTEGPARLSAGLGQSPAQNRFRAQQDYIGSGWGSSAPESNQALTRSVVKALGGGSGNDASQQQASYSTIVGGFEQHGNANGGRSGSSSRRHSVSVVGGPGGRRDFFHFGEGGGMSSITSPGPPAPPAGRRLGAFAFSDEELLPEKLDNALNLEIDQSRKRGYDIADTLKSPGGRDIPQSQAGGAGRSLASASLPHYVPGGTGASQAMYGSVAPSRNKDPFAPEYGIGTSPARGRLETLQASTDRARSGGSSSSPARSRFSFDQPGSAGSPTGAVNLAGQRVAGSTSGASALGPAISGASPDRFAERGRTTQTAPGQQPAASGGPGAIGGPTAYDTARMQQQQQQQPSFNPFPSGGQQQQQQRGPDPRTYGVQNPYAGGNAPAGPTGYNQASQAYGRQPYPSQYYNQSGPASRGPGGGAGAMGYSGSGMGAGGYPPAGMSPYGQQQPPIPHSQSYYGNQVGGAPGLPPHAPTPSSPSSFSTLSLSDLGKGLPLTSLSPTTPLYIVAFKAGRRDVFYCPDPTLLISNGDSVIVEADRGSDLGTVVYDQLTPVHVREWQEKQATAALLSGAREHQPPGLAVQQHQQEQQQMSSLGRNSSAPMRPAGPGTGSGSGSGSVGAGAGDLAGADLHTLLSGVGPSGVVDSGAVAVRGPLAKEIMPKRIFAKSSQGPEDQARMMEKLRDEHDAMMMCREKVAQRGLPMQIVDAEYQWRKLTFYFKADKRVDFRDLTKDLFRMVKSRIWMSMVPRDDPRQG